MNRNQYIIFILYSSFRCTQFNGFKTMHTYNNFLATNYLNFTSDFKTSCIVLFMLKTKLLACLEGCRGFYLIYDKLPKKSCTKLNKMWTKKPKYAPNVKTKSKLFKIVCTIIQNKMYHLKKKSDYFIVWFCARFILNLYKKYTTVTAKSEKK